MYEHTPLPPRPAVSVYKNKNNIYKSTNLTAAIFECILQFYMQIFEDIFENEKKVKETKEKQKESGANLIDQFK